MPRTLLLMRHAKSSWKQGDLPDHDRPLKKRGKHDARAMGRALRRLKLAPDRIITSTARRARSTARHLARALERDLPLHAEPRLYGATPGGYLEVMLELPAKAKTVLLVGHDPAISDFCTLIADQQHAFATGDIVEIELPVDTWSDYRIERHEGRVTRILTRKDVKDEE